MYVHLFQSHHPERSLEPLALSALLLFQSLLLNLRQLPENSRPMEPELFVTTSKAPVTTSKALVSNSFLLLLVRHLLLLAWHLLLLASCYYSSSAS